MRYDHIEYFEDVISLVPHLFELGDCLYGTNNVVESRNVDGTHHPFIQYINLN